MGHVNITLISNTGVGKSTLLNAIIWNDYVATLKNRKNLGVYEERVKNNSDTGSLESWVFV